MEQMVLPITERMFWLLMILVGIAVFSALVFGVLPGVRETSSKPPREPLQARMGLADLDSGLFILFFGFWLLVTLSLLTGFVALLWEVIAQTAPQEATAIWDWRFTLAKLTALTATLGAVVALPVTIIRLRLNYQQTETAKEALFNDKINAAATDLAARRQVTRVVKQEGQDVVLTEWEDDLVSRAAAIDRLEGLANERPDTAPRIARQLSIYVRELSREYPPNTFPKDTPLDGLANWLLEIDARRPDIEKAAQTLGRMQNIRNAHLNPNDVDLSFANMQRFDLKKKNYDNATLFGAYMHGATLNYTSLKGADLTMVDMHGSYLLKTQMQAANLERTELFGARLLEVSLLGASLKRTNLRGAELIAVEMDQSTQLHSVSLRGASIRFLNSPTLEVLRPYWQTVFADGYTQLSDGEVRPKHWHDEALSLEDFREKWREWLATLPPE